MKVRHGVTQVCGALGLIGLAMLVNAGCHGGAAGPGQPAADGANQPAAPGVGDPCIPSDEYRLTFSGFSADEVSVERSSPHCSDSNACLVNHFQGRVSCPYGQTQSALGERKGDDPLRCSKPGTTGTAAADQVIVPVAAQLEDRQAAEAVYCSCRCADAQGNTNKGGPYCRCPGGYSCEPVVVDLGIDSGVSELGTTRYDTAGSYCIKEDTAFDPHVAPRPCQQDSDPSTGRCGPARPESNLPAPAEASGSVNTFLTGLHVSEVDKLDLLLVIDNSMGMADKQALLAQAVPALVDRLVDPLCTDDQGSRVPPQGGGCPPGMSPQLSPIRDLHIAVVSSSLGGHGGTICDPAGAEPWGGRPEMDDRGELVAPLRGVTSWVNPATGAESGLLKWDPDGRYRGGTTDRDTLVEQLTTLVESVGDSGCGYEAPLEAWYRFLLDPQPPVAVRREDGLSVPGAVNTQLLEQRSWFLRPDSAVAIVMLTDENDCSVRDDGAGWLVGNVDRPVPRASSSCETSPNDPCCRSCALRESELSSGCPPLDSDPSCALGDYSTSEDSFNLRCFQQKRRFGIDFLYPVTRYVDGLRQSTVSGRVCSSDADCRSNHPSQPDGKCVQGAGSARTCEYPNPLFALNPNYPGQQLRMDSSLVLLAGIVGVPWQDLATSDTLADPDRLEYLRAPELSAQGRWEAIVGEPTAGIPPADPFMLESTDPRMGSQPNPITGDLPAPPDSAVNASRINGHEYTSPQQDSLQYTCIFPLASPRECTDDTRGDCACRASANRPPDRPLCQAPGTGVDGITQYFAGAHPGLRLLEVLRGYGTNSIVASVCPKLADPERSEEPGYGYLPAVDALAARAAELFQPACLPRALPPLDDGSLACRIIEAIEPSAGVSCDSPGRAPLEQSLAAPARDELDLRWRCNHGNTPCSELVLCELLPATDRESCLHNPVPDAASTGYCYIDASQDRNRDGVFDCEPGPDYLQSDCLGNPELVARCPPSARRILRFVGDVPDATATLLIGCTAMHW